MDVAREEFLMLFPGHNISFDVYKHKLMQKEQQMDEFQKEWGDIVNEV